MALSTDTINYEGAGSRFEGLCVYDAASARPRPGVLIAHTAKGRSPFEAGRAEALAQLGYVGFVADLYGEDDLPKSSEEAIASARKLVSTEGLLISRMNAAVTAMRSHRAVDPRRIAAIGYCLGGTAVLNLARAGADFAGVVSLHGGLRPAAKPTVSPMKAKVLILHGWDDPFAPPDLVPAIAKELTEAQADWQIHAYGLTGHGFTDPKVPSDVKGVYYKADADRRSWKALTDFLAELFPSA